MGPVVANHHGTQRRGQFRKKLPRERDCAAAIPHTLRAENPNYEVGSADSLDLV